jgi:hypothetical protein
MGMAKLPGAISVTAAALALAAVGVETAAAAPPIACVRNLTGVELDVVVGAQENAPDRPGLYWGKAAARVGACRYADIDGPMNVYFRRAAPLPPADDEDSRVRFLSTATGGWKACPALESRDGWYVYTVRRGLFGVTCKAGGETRDLEGPGDYE